MSGIIFDIKRFALHDGPGIRTTVFFKGCPLHCGWCHNPESISPLPISVARTVKLNGQDFTKDEVVGYSITPTQLFAELQKEQIFMNESGGGVTFSGGEPLLQHQFLLQMLRLCKNHEIHTAVDTTLFAAWDTVRQVAELSDLFLVDLKLMDDAKHRQYTGVSNRMILDNIKKLSAWGATFRIRIPVIPSVNLTDENIEQSIRFLQQLPNPVQGVDLLPFHNTASQKYKRIQTANAFEKIPSLKKEDLETIKKQFENAGYTVKIGG